MRYGKGDIVLVNDFVYPDGGKGTLHSFVVTGAKGEEVDLIPLEYLCFLISSQKSKEELPFNEPIGKDGGNRLQKDSHVKCDYLYGIPEEKIIMHVGSVTPEQYLRFMELYDASKG